jgi:hypothetical protein
MKPLVDKNNLNMPSCGRAEALRIQERRALDIQRLATGLLARLQAALGSGTQHGCAYCRSEILQRSPSLEKRFDIQGIFSDTAERGTASYRKADIYECPRCQMYWLDYFDEVDSVDAKFEEWGNVLRGAIALDRTEVDRIRIALEAMATGTSDL